MTEQLAINYQPISSKNMESTEQISAEELQAFRAYKAKQEEARQRQAFREQYVELVDAEVASCLLYTSDAADEAGMV